MFIEVLVADGANYPRDSVENVEFSKDKTKLAVEFFDYDADSLYRIYDISLTPKILCSFSVNKPLKKMQFSDDGSMLYLFFLDKKENKDVVKSLNLKTFDIKDVFPGQITSVDEMGEKLKRLKNHYPDFIINYILKNDLIYDITPNNKLILCYDSADNTITFFLNEKNNKIYGAQLNISALDSVIFAKFLTDVQLIIGIMPGCYLEIIKLEYKEYKSSWKLINDVNQVTELPKICFESYKIIEDNSFDFYFNVGSNKNDIITHVDYKKFARVLNLNTGKTFTYRCFSEDEIKNLIFNYINTNQNHLYFDNVIPTAIQEDTIILLSSSRKYLIAAKFVMNNYSDLYAHLVPLFIISSNNITNHLTNFRVTTLGQYCPNCHKNLKNAKCSSCGINLLDISISSSTFIEIGLDSSDIYGLLKLIVNGKEKYLGFKLSFDPRKHEKPNCLIFKTPEEFLVYLNALKEKTSKNLVSFTYSVGSIPIIIPTEKLRDESIPNGYIRGLLYIDKYINLLCYKTACKPLEKRKNSTNPKFKNTLTIEFISAITKLHEFSPSPDKVLDVEKIKTFLSEKVPEIIRNNNKIKTLEEIFMEKAYNNYLEIVETSKKETEALASRNNVPKVFNLVLFPSVDFVKENYPNVYKTLNIYSRSFFFLNNSESLADRIRELEREYDIIYIYNASRIWYYLENPIEFVEVCRKSPSKILFVSQNGVFVNPMSSSNLMDLLKEGKKIKLQDMIFETTRKLNQLEANKKDIYDAVAKFVAYRYQISEAEDLIKSIFALDLHCRDYIPISKNEMDEDIELLAKLTVMYIKKFDVTSKTTKMAFKLLSFDTPIFEHIGAEINSPIAELLITDEELWKIAYTLYFTSIELTSRRVHFKFKKQ